MHAHGNEMDEPRVIRWDAFTAAWSPDGRLVATGGKDRQAAIWDAAGREVKRLKGHSHIVHCVAWSPDGRLLASAGEDQLVKVWDVITWREIGEIRKLRPDSPSFRGHSGNLCWSPASDRLASGSLDGALIVWDVASGEEVLRTHGHSSSLTCTAWSPDGRRLASGSQDRTVKIWDALSGEELLTLCGHVVKVNEVAWSPDGRRLASTDFSSVNAVKIWDAPGYERSPVERR